MESEIYNKCLKINEELKNHPDVKELERLNDELESSFEVHQLVEKKDEAMDFYLHVKDSLKEDDPLYKEAVEKYRKAKLELEAHPLVKAYNEAYAKVEKLYDEIDEILFSEFRGKKVCQ